MIFQLPTDTPNPSQNTPIDLTSIFDIVVFIVAPVIMVFLYFFLRKKERPNNDSKNEDNT
ncbi:MAG: adenylosuccinate synthetase [Flavobacteriaceae bacterium]